MKKLDLTGERFGYLYVIKEGENYAYPSGRTRTQWLCRCDCGNEVSISTNNLKSGNTKSCGCKKQFLSLNTFKDNNGNRYEFDGETGIGYTKNGTKFYFDKEDYDKVKKYKWNVTSKGYICTHIKVNGKKKCLFLHRYIMSAEEGISVDHIRGRNSKTDNRKSNLRIASNSQNRFNTPLQKNNTSGYTGVYWIRHMKKWHAQIIINKQNINLGYFENIEDAITARKEAEEKYQGEFSFDNSQKL